MTFVTIDVPPGIYRAGTKYKSRGRFYDANLWRWFAGTSGPVGGWSVHSTSAVSGKPRATITWRDNSNLAWAGIGTHTGLYVMSRSGAISNITPSGFTAGRANAVGGAGFGAGTFGTGTFGAPRNSAFQVIDASVWSLDTWGEYLVGVMPEDGKIYQWTLNTATPAARITNSPTAVSVVVTAERIMMALGASGNPRQISTSDQGDNTVWTTTVTNYARSQILQTTGKLMCGKRVTGGTLLFTDVDVWLATFVGQPFVYGYEKRGTNCGVVSPQCVAVTDASVFWMGRSGFWAYNGYTNPLPCEVQDYVFSDINLIQVSKIWAIHNSAFGEVTWFYCSASSNEIDRYVTYNYRENHWTIGQLVRLSGTDRGAFLNPIMVGDDGIVYDHESGWTHGGVSPYAKTGPLELGQGDNLFSVEQIVPDEKSLGSVTVSFDANLYPMRAPLSYGPYTLTDLTDARLTARQVEMTFSGIDGQQFNVGSFRLDGKQRGKR